MIFLILPKEKKKSLRFESVYCFILRAAFNLMCTVYFVLAIVLANSYTVYCLLFLKTVNSTKITVKKKKTVLPVSPVILANNIRY